VFRRLFLVNTRLYTLSASGTAMPTDSPDVEKFFGSFQVK
jgi:hypothetical protein